MTPSSPHPFQSWLLAIRPKTLTMAAVPVIAGNALVWAGRGDLSWMILLLTLLASVGVQAGTNLYNDAADFEKGVDGPERLGPERAAAQGWLSPRAIYAGAHISFLIAWLAGGWLIWTGGGPILAIAILATLSGYLYTAGPRPLSGTPLGELFVFLFFGVAAVAGSAYLQTFLFSRDALVLGAALGSLAAAVLLVNNHRDRVSDAASGRRTLAILLGPVGTARLYALLLALPFGALIPLYLHHQRPGLFLALGAAYPAVGLIKALRNDPVDRNLNRVLVGTAKLQVLFAGLFCLGLLVS